MKNEKNRNRVLYKIGIVAIAVVLMAGIVIYILAGKKPETGKESETAEPARTEENASDENHVLPEQTEALDGETELQGFQPSEAYTEGTGDTGISIPYQVPDTSLQVEKIGSYTGPFLEDGSDEPMGSVTAMVVKNLSGRVVQYAELHFQVNDTEEAVFTLSTLPSGGSALVLEASKRQYSPDDRYQFEDMTYAEMEEAELTLMEGQIQVNGSDGKITVENLTDEDMDLIYVRYKYRLPDGTYQGGITYETKFEKVRSKAAAEKEAPHYSEEGSQIMMVGYVREE